MRCGLCGGPIASPEEFDLGMCGDCMSGHVEAYEPLAVEDLELGGEG